MVDLNSENLVELIKRAVSAVNNETSRPRPDCTVVFNEQFFSLTSKIDRLIDQNEGMAEQFRLLAKRIEVVELLVERSDVEIRDHGTRLKAAEDYIQKCKKERDDFAKNRSGVLWKVLAAISIAGAFFGIGLFKESLSK